MHVIEVTPLVKATTVPSLSYYSAQPYEIGSIISVPIRNKTVPAMVSNVKPVSKAKTALKAATFSLRKLENIEKVAVLPQNIIHTAKELAKTNPASAGAIIYSLLPPDIRNGVREYPGTTSQKGQEDSTPTIYTGTIDDRFLIYKSKIREAFAHRASVVLVVPNSVSVTQVAKKLSQGIEKRVITFSSVHTKKQIVSSYEAFADLSKAKLIITTPNFAMLDRHDITTIIVEESGSPHYQSRTRPYLDARSVLKTYAKVSGKSILLGDTLPLTEDEHFRREEMYHTHDEHPRRLQFLSSFEIVDHNAHAEEFAIISPQLEEKIKVALRNKGKAFLFCPRKGLSPLVTCYDCGHVFRCPDSGAPYSLFRKFKGEDEERWFICGTSGKRVRAADTCPDCGSWRLREQGIGIQQVEDTMKKLSPKATIFKLDHETATTYNKALKIAKEFYETKQSILLGTAMALPYLDQPVDVTAITSYEALRSIPTWRAEEQTLTTILKLREKTTKDCVIQIRTEEDQLLKISKQAMIDQFYEDEIAVRQAVKYPPFAHFILLTYAGSKDQTDEIESDLNTLLPGFKLQSYNNPLPQKNKQIRHTLIRIKAKDWPDEHLMEVLRSLPPQIKIEINPMRII